MVAAVGLLADADGWGHMGGWGGGWMSLWGIAMMALFVILIVWLVRASTAPTGPSGSAPRDPVGRAREILAERYAKGELTTKEYQERVSEPQ